jgi:hypothetical protein
MTVAIGSCNGDGVLSPDKQGILAAGAAGNAPSGLAAVAVSSSQINLYWTDNSSNEDGFEVHRSVNGAPFTLLAPTAPNAVSYSNLGLSPATSYCYQVRAYRRTGKNTAYSAFSTSACATTAPAAPSNTNVTPASSNVVDVTWTDNSATEDGFRVERAASSQGTWTLVAVTPANVTSYREWYVPAEQLVCYRVTGFGPGGSSDPSNVDCTTPPAAPAGLTATPTADNAIALAWAPGSGVQDGYEVQRSDPSGIWTVIANLPANAASHRDAAVSTDIPYSYRLRAKKDGGFSDFSSTATALIAGTPPAAPSVVTAIPAGSTVVAVLWNDNSLNEEGFVVKRSTDGQATWVTAFTAPPGYGSGSRQSASDGDRESEQRVCYQVFAYNAKDSSDKVPVGGVCTTPPAAPTDLVATTASDYAVNLQWANHSTTADGYAVQRVYYSGYYYYNYEYYETIATVGPGETSYHDGGHSPGEYNTYRVLALKDGGQSDPSNQASAWTEFPPPAPTGLTAMPGATAGHIDLAWTYATGDADYIGIERCTGDASACGDSNFNLAVWIDGASRSFSDGGLQGSITYTYRVRAFRRGQTSEWPSNTASATAP